MARQGHRAWHRLTPEAAASHLAAWRESGETLGAYARVVRLSYKRLHRWQPQLGEESATERPAFLPVQVLEAGLRSSGQKQLAEGGGPEAVGRAR